MHYLDIELEGINETGEISTYKLKDFKGKNIIVYFYPQDDTPVCTQEAHDFRDAIDKIKEYAQIIGVSSDNIESHTEFQKNHKLNYILLSDTDNKLKQAFEDHNENIINMHRATFILDKNGNIIKYWDKVDIDGHVEEIIDFLSKNK